MAAEEQGAPRQSVKGRLVWALKNFLNNRPAYHRWRARYDARLPDLEVRQLRSLIRAYESGAGPDILLFGDSTMFWTRPGDKDPRMLTQIVTDELAGEATVHSIVGPGYNVRLVASFMDALDKLPSRPKVVVVPMSLMMASDSWIRHPIIGAAVEAEAIRGMIAKGEPFEDRLPRASDADWNTYDRLPAASLSGAKQTYGEIRMIINAIPSTAAGAPTTNWQQLIRVRHLLNLSNAGRLEESSLGVVLAKELSEQLAARKLPSIAYIPPVNLTVIKKFWGDAAVDQVLANGQIMEDTYRGAGGGIAEVLNTIPMSPEEDFADPAHLNAVGRVHLANEIVGVLRTHLKLSQ